MEQSHHDRSPEHRRAREGRSFDDEASLLIQAGIDQALAHRRPLDETTARLIAFALAPSTVSNLTLFARTGGRGPHTDNAALRDEYLPTYHDPNTPDGIRELIDWLGAHLITRENPGQALPQPDGPPLLRNLLWRTTVRVGEYDVAVSVCGDRPNEAVAALPGQLTPLLTTYGDAMITFLGLPDVDATSPHLEESFTDTYRGSYANPAEAIAQLTDLTEINAAVTAIAARYTGGEFVSLDHEALWNRLCEIFDVVEIGGSYHIFDR